MTRGDVLVVVSALAIVCRSLMSAVAGPDDCIELLPAEIALGAIPEGDERMVELAVSNRGGTRTDVVIVPSCTCVTPADGRLQLEPFSNVIFSVRVKTARRPGYNAAQVQIATPSGTTLGQCQITFTAVRGIVFDPPVLFLRGGEQAAVAAVYSLAESIPMALVAISDDPAVQVSMKQDASRRWEIAIFLTGRPRGSLSVIRVVDRRSAGDETVGILTVSLPATRIGDVRLSSVAERMPDGRLRAWLLFDTEARCEIRVLSLRATLGEALDWKAEQAIAREGSHLWLEMIYSLSLEPTVLELEVEVGGLRELITATLPRAPA